MRRLGRWPMPRPPVLACRAVPIFGVHLLILVARPLPIDIRIPWGVSCTCVGRSRSGSPSQGVVMARVVILGAGVSGHTAALHLRRRLSKKHEVVVVSPNSRWNWIPSNIWVGVGRMTKDDVTFPLAPVYRRHRIDYRHAKAVAVWPEGEDTGGGSAGRGGVDIVYTDTARAGQTERLEYDFLVNATGPKLNFARHPRSRADDGHTVSVCTADHAEHAAAALEQVYARLAAGERQTLVIGVGHGTCTCEGAAFEYAFNVEHELRERGLRDLGGRGLPDQRVRAGRLRRRRHVLQAGRVRHHQPAVDRVAVHRARGAGHPAGPRAARRGRQAVLRDPRRHPVLARVRLRNAAAAVPRRGPGRPTTGTARTSPRPCSRPAASSRSTPTTRQRRTTTGAPPTGPAPTSAPRYGNVFGVGIAFAPPHPISRAAQEPVRHGHLPGTRRALGCRPG